MAKKKLTPSTQATITKVEICDVLDLWRKKPQQLRFDDTDVLIVTAKAGNKEIKETFFTCLKPDGTFNIKTANKTSQARRQKLASFLKYYFKVADPKRYNLKESIKDWEGKKVKLEKDFIYLP